jgi:hypothetical protein
MQNILGIFIITIFSLNINACGKKDSSDDSPAATNSSTAAIKIVNVSDVSTSDIETWTATAAAKMKNQTANILSVSWNVGEQVSEGGFNRPFNTHQVQVTSEQIETMMTQHHRLDRDHLHRFSS